ncbi:MAG TPA: hypothetical protein PKW18_05995 [Candidatus Sumerlaeota bacterium]|jgi:hypothetical protein|nr:MAG: hypothetical protein BWY12_02011 [candidate division BRC1 bacterium ADurb.Bin183]HOE62417.1 hypothetical protein [Candidatus Sumerlaeota bacterium]HRR30928.1 hypothetical protein [Candidatus Sumerlaeia bacterium]HON50142.1 hypothetical protein [Candidatus Sumerlaeota bacterium]HOR63358.1 hypothetical protein [Candidatus Sumerlaeota bacterium]
MTKEYKYDFINNHIIADIDGSSLLIDTGSPSSFAESHQIVMDGNRFAVSEKMLNVSAEFLTANIGAPINGLVGIDILNQFDILIDPTNQRLLISKEEIPLKGQILELDNIMGIPLIEGVIDGCTARLIFDTGAKLSYLNPKWTSDLPIIGTEDDFYPAYGSYTSNIYEIPIMLGNERIMPKVGNLPALLQMTLGIMDMDGILGVALLLTHKIAYAPRRKKMALERVND